MNSSAPNAAANAALNTAPVDVPMTGSGTGPLATLLPRLTLPLIAAPMFRVSGPELVIAACRAGVIGAFPTANCRSVDEFDQWITRIEAAVGPTDAPWCPNLIMRRVDLKQELAVLLRHRVEVVITSVGAPDPVVAPLHDIGCLVLADVASVRHAEKAVAAGVDGLILLTAGAGGQTGWANGFAFARAVRDHAGPDRADPGRRERTQHEAVRRGHQLGHAHLSGHLRNLMAAAGRRVGRSAARRASRTALSIARIA